MLGWLIATAFSLYVLILYALRGPAPFEANETTLSATIAAYYAGLTASGIVLGLVLPLARWKLGAALLGFLALIPLYGVIMFSLHGWNWDYRDTLATVIAALVVGAPVGLVYRSLFLD